METRFLPSKFRRFAYGVEITLAIAVSTFSFFMVAVGVVALFEDPSNLIGWLPIIFFSGLSGFALLRISYAWKRLHQGILVKEQGLTLYGIELSWEQITEVYTNPHKDHITFCVLRTDSKTPVLHVFKYNVSEFGPLIEQIQAFGIAVVNEDFPEHNG